MKDESDVKNQDSMAEWRLDTVFDYHQRTMHHLDRYARALGYLDWDTQPDPFRRFEGSRLIPLKQTLPVSDPAYDTVFGPEVIKTQPVNHTTLSQLFYYSLALSAWKAVGPSRWSLRVNPSSGNLHPTEGYLIVGPIGDLTDAGGVFHYAPYPHAFEERFKFSGKLWDLVSSDLPDGTFLVGLASIYWRESWKYGERAFRYCQHDVGHAVAAITIAARMQGWRTILLERPTDASIACLLGIDRQFGFEAEHADCLLAILPCATTGDDSFSHDWDIPQEVLESLAATNPTGVPNQLSQDYHEWEVIETVSEVSVKIKPPNEDFWFQLNATESLQEPRYTQLSASDIVRQRRSALAMDGSTEISRNTFYRILRSVVPDINTVVFRTIPWRPCIHLAVFVHRVQSLPQGLYVLVREPAVKELLQHAMSQEFDWENPEDCPSDIGFYRLAPGDFRAVSKVVSCHQDIASDGIFSLGMLAEFEMPLVKHGAWFYKRLFWETGIIGQVLYLEAEAAGIRSTGIGCFFDDVMHKLLGIRNRQFQSLYHFTMGGPVEDPRLRSEQAYAHLESDQHKHNDEGA